MRTHAFCSLCHNDLVERIIKLSNDAQRQLLLQKLAPDLVTVACNMDGSFAVQALIDSLSTADHLSTLFSALLPAIDRLITSRSGYFVILRSLEKFPYSHTQVVDHAIVSNGMVVCNNRYGLQVSRFLLHR